MSEDAKLILEAPLHVGVEFELVDPVLKSFGQRILEKNNAINVERRILELMEADIMGVKQIFWARVAEVLPATRRWDMQLSANCTHVIVAGPPRQIQHGDFGGLPLEIQKAISNALNKKDE